MMAAYAPLTAAHVKKAHLLTSTTIGMHQQSVGQQPPVSFKFSEMAPSLPVVDRWLMNVVCSLTQYLDIVWDVMDSLYYSWGPLDLSKFIKTVKNLRQVLIITAAIEGDETKFVLDLNVPPELNWIRPTVVVTKPAEKPKRQLCCTPVRFTKPTSVTKK